MSCPHAETTTVAWLYGEGSDEHALHAATCPDCQAVVALHEEVAHATAAPRRAPAGRSVGAPRRRAWIGLSVALAAAAVLATIGLAPRDDGRQAPPGDVGSAEDVLDDPIDDELRALAGAVALPDDEFTDPLEAP